MASNLLRAQDAARFLGVSKCLIYQLVRSGKIQTVRINSAIRFREEDLFKFIENNLSTEQGFENPPSGQTAISGG